MPRVKHLLLWIPGTFLCCFGLFSVFNTLESGVIEGALWRGDVITYRDLTSRPDEVGMAAASWNRVEGVPEFIEVDDGPSDVLIEEYSIAEMEDICPMECYGRVAFIGRVPGLQQKIMMRETVFDGLSLNYANTVSHELGHVIGLQHTSAHCAIMSNSESQCAMLYTKAKSGYLSMCGPLPEDVARIPGASGWGGWCPSSRIPWEGATDSSKVSELTPDRRTRTVAGQTLDKVRWGDLPDWGVPPPDPDLLDRHVVRLHETPDGEIPHGG